MPRRYWNAGATWLLRWLATLRYDGTINYELLLTNYAFQYTVASHLPHIEYVIAIIIDNSDNKMKHLY